jgi:phage tail sheath gpL-like
MTTAPATIVGFVATNKRPGFYADIQFGVGAQSAASIPQYCLCVGTKIAAGIAAVDADVLDIRSPEDADTYFGAGSEVARMCYAALRVAGVGLKATAVSEAVGAAAATATITVGGTWEVSGSLLLWIDGELLSLGIGVADTPATVAAAIVALVDGKPRLPVTAATAAGSGSTHVVTLTRKSKGERGLWGSLFQDKSKIPTGMTCVIAGGASMTGGGVHFTGGTGVETPTATIANLHPGRYKYTALAQNDLTTINAAGMWRDTNFAKAGSNEGRVQFMVVGSSDTYSNATALARGVNDGLFYFAWMYNSRAHPSELAAEYAALRQVKESLDPGASYDGEVLPGIAPHFANADSPSSATQEGALNNGVTPLISTPDGKVAIVRAITSRCLVGGIANYATLDVADAAVPVFVRDDMGIDYETSVKPGNPRMADDRPDGADRPQGVWTPKRATVWATHKMKRYEGGVNGSPPLVIDVDFNLPVAGWSEAQKCIIVLLPVKVAPGNHQLGMSIRQVALWPIGFSSLRPSITTTKKWPS